MSTINFGLLIPVEKFPARFKNIGAVQNTMSKLYAHQAGHRKNVYDFIEDEMKDKVSILRDKKELEKARDRIPSLERELEELKGTAAADDVVSELARLKSKRETLERKFENRDEADMIVEEMKHFNSRLYAEGVEAWVDQLGNWFSEGHLGPGTVNYGDKTFTAE